MTRTLLRRLALGAATIFLAACGDDPAGPSPVETVEVTSPAQSITAGQTAQLAVVMKDEDGEVLADRAVAWSTDRADVATVSAAGMVTAVAPGTAVVTATSEGKTGSVTLTILPIPIATLTLSPSPATVAVGATTQLTLVARDAAGNVLGGRTATLTTSNAAIASVDANRVVSGLSAGSVTITATAEGKTATATVNVVPGAVTSVEVTPGTASVAAGSTQQLSATARDASGAAVTGRAVSWSTSNPSIATVSSTGMVTAVAAGGPVTISATAEGKSGSASITVTPAPIATLTLSPNPSEVKVGLTAQLLLVARDAAGNELGGRPATLTTSNAAVATVDANRTVTGVSAGTVTITATSEGKTATTTVNVVPGPVTSVTLAPTTPSVRVGATIPMTATLRDASGAALTGRAVTWTSSDPSKATVTSTGVVTGVAVGTTTITATSEGKSASTTVTVLRMPVSSVQVLVIPGLIVGELYQVQAVARDSLGNELPGRSFTYSSSDPTVATISSTGVLSALKGGAVKVTVTSEGVSGTSENVNVADVRLSWSAAPCFSVKVGQTCTTSATLRYAGTNTQVPGRAPTAIESADPSKATTSSPVTSGSGLTVTVTGVSAGNVQLIARYVGANGVTRSDTFDFVVTP